MSELMAGVHCANCGKPVSQMGIAYLNRWSHNHSGSERCGAPPIAIPVADTTSPSTVKVEMSVELARSFAHLHTGYVAFESDAVEELRKSSAVALRAEGLE